MFKGQRDLDSIPDYRLAMDMELLAALAVVFEIPEGFAPMRGDSHPEYDSDPSCTTVLFVLAVQN